MALGADQVKSLGFPIYAPVSASGSFSGPDGYLYDYIDQGAGEINNVPKDGDLWLPCNSLNVVGVDFVAASGNSNNASVEIRRTRSAGAPVRTPRTESGIAGGANIDLGSVSLETYSYVTVVADRDGTFYLTIQS